MRNYIGVGVGIVIGAAATLVGQQLLTRSDSSPTSTRPEPSSLDSRRQDQQLTVAKERIAELEGRLADASPLPGSGASATTEPTPAPESGEAAKARSFIEMMMSFGDDDAMRKIDLEVERLSELLGLSENQQAVVLEALLGRFNEKKTAGVKLMTGQASIADLIASDEHNFVKLDAAIRPVLDEAQLESYQAEQLAREQRRIETKTEEELGKLASVTELSSEQQDAAWEVLAEINAAEPPGEVPEGTTVDDFVALLDGAIDNRVRGLEPILNPDQLQIYHGQTEAFRNQILTLISHATGSDVAPAETLK